MKQIGKEKKMKQIGLFLAIFLVGALLFGCSTKVVPAEIPITPEALPLEAPSAKSTSSLGGSPVETSGWEVEWEKTLKEARKEGKIVIYGPAPPSYRHALVDAFQQVYPNIAVDYFGLGGPQKVARIQTERRGGIFTVDLVIGGTSTVLTSILKDYAVPIEPYLILPEVKDGKYWRDGKLHFADSGGKLNLVWSGQLSWAVAYNTELIDPREMKNFSYWELTKPKWKGKVLWDDPRLTGSSQEAAKFILDNPQLGPEYLKTLVRNEPVILRDKRLAHEWVARGKYPFLLGVTRTQIEDFAAEGLPIAGMSKSKEGAYVGAGNSSVIVLDRALHPNATKVYLNWLLSREAQIVWVKEIDNISRRVDVPDNELANPETVPSPGKNYPEFYTEEALKRYDMFMQQLIDIIGK